MVLFSTAELQKKLKATSNSNYTFTCKNPYKPKMPFQFFLFFSKFFYFLLKKKINFVLLKRKSKSIPELLYRFFKDQVLFFFFKESKIVGNFISKLNSFSLNGFSLLLHFFFLNCSKKNMASVLRLNQFIKRTASESNAKGFFSLQKGKLA